jgi:hypothetical protein
MEFSIASDGREECHQPALAQTDAGYRADNVDDNILNRAVASRNPRLNRFQRQR